MGKVLTKGLFIKLLCMLLIIIGCNIAELDSPHAMAYGASKPIIKVTSVNLYVKYKNYQIQIYNLSEKAQVMYQSSNEAVAAVTGKGLITPVSKGKAEVKVSILQSNHKYNYTVSVTVKEPSLTISNPVNEIEANDKYIFSAVTQGLKKPNLEWSCSNEAVGVIDRQTGEFTAKLVGKAMIQVKDKTSGKTKKIQLEVIAELDPEDYGFDIGISDNEVTIYGLKEFKEIVVIPDVIGGCPVTNIAPWAFYQSQIKEITFGQNIRYIADYAFFCAAQMTKAVLREGIVELADHSFDGCSKLTEFNIPDSVQRIGGYAFDGCRSLLDIKVDNTIERTLGEHIFNNVALSNPVIAYTHNVLFHLTEADKEEITLAVNALNEMGIKDTDTAVEKVKKVHDWIIYNVMWERKENDIIKIQEATGASDFAIAVKYHIGVCEHYMVAFQTFMEMLGLENMTVLNVSGTHGWNMVKLDDGWYMVDVGHDGPNGYLLYKNFLFNSTDPYVDWGDLHTYDTSQYPPVDGTKYTNYVDRSFSMEIADVYENVDLAEAYR